MPEVVKAKHHPNAVSNGAAIFDEPVSYLDLKAVRRGAAN